MKKYKYIALWALVLASCTHMEPRSMGTLKLYDDQNQLVFSSSKIKEILIFEKQTSCEIVLPASDTQNVFAATSHGGLFNVYIDDQFIEKLQVLSPINSNRIFIKLNSVSDEKKLIGIAFSINSITTTSDNE